MVKIERFWIINNKPYRLTIATRKHLIDKVKQSKDKVYIDNKNEKVYVAYNTMYKPARQFGFEEKTKYIVKRRK